MDSHKIEHKTQLVVYAILAEQQFGIPVKNAQTFRILMQNLSYRQGQKSSSCRNLEASSGDKPPKLEGQTVRCEPGCDLGMKDDEYGEIVLEAKAFENLYRQG